MNLRSDKKVKAEIFTSAMNDIMFFLMLFFIIASTLLSPNIIKLNLPSAENSQSIHKKEIQVSVDKDLQYFVDKTQVSFEQLPTLLAQEVAQNPEAYVVLRCDNTLSVQQLVDVLQIGNSLNIKMILATKKD